MTTMNKQATFLLFFFSALLSITAPTSGIAAKPPVNHGQQIGAQHELTIFFSNDVRGETEPCG